MKLGLSSRIQLSRWMANVTSNLDPAPGTVYVTESHGGEAPGIAYATIAYQG
jgi:hypothetical protein